MVIHSCMWVAHIAIMNVQCHNWALVHYPQVMEEIQEMMTQPVKLSETETHHLAIALFSLYLALKGFHAAADRE